ncbi:glycosyltransferase family 4 protein [Gillisia sp. Hel_I_29]|uniref:glycosyltransferase family 4 protein n=1 Tax=Gillisia sp. Hel_I_29 TaxID=1249975 RepID=UPI00054EE184|nr:glycosyltransferase family 4 protein [Gillisia sp. Hel_I_29]
MKLAVITHILHKQKNEEYYSYEPYVREMNIWFKYASDVIVVAPLSEGSITSIESKYLKDTISFKRIPQISFSSHLMTLKSVFKMPFIVFRIIKAMNAADHIHLRCPGNIGLIGCVLQIFFPQKPKTVKYAGNWDPNAEQPWSYKWQKKILSNARLSKNIKVLVYGEWDGQTKNIIPFFTASFSRTEKINSIKKITTPYKFVFVGTLNEGKRPFFTIKLIENLIQKRIPVTLEMYGNGDMKKELEEYITINNLDPFIKLMGNQNLKIVKEAYCNSRFLILASKSEGWPKAIAEAMYFGCIPIATNISCVDWMLDYGKRGILIEPNVESATRKIEDKLSDISKLQEMSENAMEWSQQYTLEFFDEAIKSVIKI